MTVAPATLRQKAESRLRDEIESLNATLEYAASAGQHNYIYHVSVGAAAARYLADQGIFASRTYDGSGIRMTWSTGGDAPSALVMKLREAVRHPVADRQYQEVRRVMNHAATVDGELEVDLGGMFFMMSKVGDRLKADGFTVTGCGTIVSWAA